MAINYIEKGIGLHDAIIAAGLSLWQEGGEWKTAAGQDSAVQAIIDGYDPLPPAREKKWREIQARRDALAASGVMVGSHRFHSDTPSRIQQLGLVMMGAGMPSGLNWKTMSGAFVTMKPTLALQIFQATAASDAAIFGAAEAHKAAVYALESVALIEAYDHLSGWPV